MPRKRKKKNKNLPRGANPFDYVFVDAKNGSHYRKKRGTVKPAKLNATFRKNADSNKIIMGVAKRIVDILSPHTHGLEKDGLHARLAGLLRKPFRDAGIISFPRLRDFEFQRFYPLNDILPGGYSVEIKNDEIMVRIKLGQHYVKKQNTLATAYFFDAVIVFGDPLPGKKLRIDADTSRHYSFSGRSPEICVLTLSLPAGKQSWMLMLKISCLEGRQMASHTMHYAMKIVGTG